MRRSRPHRPRDSPLLEYVHFTLIRLSHLLRYLVPTCFQLIFRTFFYVSFLSLIARITLSSQPCFPEDQIEETVVWFLTPARFKPAILSRTGAEFFAASVLRNRREDWPVGMASVGICPPGWRVMSAGFQTLAGQRGARSLLLLTEKLIGWARGVVTTTNWLQTGKVLGSQGTESYTSVFTHQRAHMAPGP